MEETKIRRKMMELWKETFHDSDEYIELIFEKYFNPEWIEYYSVNDEIISALMAIPYQFKYGDKITNAVYLCGLATNESFRNKGIMSSLISEINKKAKSRGMAFSFLIPASDTLRLYYQNKGYINGMYRIEERFTSIHDFKKEALSYLHKEDDNIRALKQEYFRNIQINILDNSGEETYHKIIKYIETKESQRYPYSLMLHSSEDISTALIENRISGGEIYYAIDYKYCIRGCAFVTFDSTSRLIIPKIYFDDNYVYYRILDRIKKNHSEFPMSVFRFPEEVQRKAIWGVNYIEESQQHTSSVQFGATDGVYKVATHSEPYGMVKILNLDEILKFLSNSKRDLKFTILIKDQYGQIQRITEKDRVYVVEPTENRKEFDNEVILTEEELFTLLLRRKDNSNLINETLRIPRLSLNMALLLD